MPEPRTPVMIVVEVSWQDAGGALQTASARMEDKSAHGACIRFKRPIDVGTRLQVQWRFEQFSGVIKYCRKEDRDFVVGLEKDANPAAIVKSPSEVLPAGVAIAPPVPTEAQIVLAPLSAGTARTPPPKTLETSVVMPAPQIELVARAARYERDVPRWRHASRIRGGVPLRRIENKTETPKGTEAGPERKPMKRKWLDLAPWHNKPESSTETNSEASDADVKASAVPYETSRVEKENVMFSTTPAEKSVAHSSREVPTFQVELLPTEEVFRAAGIAVPRRGYSIAKVIEMINSEHIRNLSKEMKRAAVLMALDAAGVSIDQIQRDAKSRQDALDAYQNSQKKQSEAEWARKAEEIAQIQSELESIKAHYTARIGRCSEALARDKARFNSWVTAKEQDSRNMAEALELCVKPLCETTPCPKPMLEVAGMAMASAAAAGAGNSVTGSGKPA